MNLEVPLVVRLSEYRPCDYAIDEIELSFALDPQATRVFARYHVRRLAGLTCPLVLDGARLHMESIAIDGSPVAGEFYSQDDQRLIISSPPKQFVLEIRTVLNAEENTALLGLYVSSGRFCTQCEAEGFRHIAFALDRPDALSKFTVRIEAEQRRYPALLSNGNLVETGSCGDGRHFAIWRDPHPKPCYLFALVAGEFDSIRDTFITQSGRNVGLIIHTDQGDSPRAAYAMDSLKRAMAWDERVFGREYDLDDFHIVAVRDFNFGAMENKGLNIFNSSRLLADFETATDTDFEDIERIVAHEYFHNWTGNRVTLRDWFQLCLKEGLTIYRDQEFSADQRSRPVKRIRDVKTLRDSQFGEDAGPLAHPARPASYEKIQNFYTATVYNKGGEIVRVLRELIGDSAFTRGMQLYFERWDGHGVTLEDFVACFEETWGRSLTQFFRWYTQAGTPHLTARGHYNPEAQSYHLTVSQSMQSGSTAQETLPLAVPLRVGLLAEDGSELSVTLSSTAKPEREFDLVLDTESKTFAFEGVTQRPIPTILRGYAAPVLLDDGLSFRDRRVQMASDPDPFTRWEAGQQLLIAAILAEASGRPESGPSIDEIAASLGQEIAGSDRDYALAAMALSVPNLGQLLQQAETPDPEKLFQARNHVRRLIGTALQGQLAATVEAGQDNTQPLAPRQVGRRAMRAAALGLLASLGPSQAGLILSAYQSSNNMTDTMAALEALGQIEGPWFDQALDSFLEKWRHFPLVVDKWFAVQASAPREDVVSRIRKLAGHHLFLIKNPNRARSLYDNFGSANLRAFHALDGSGYSFLGEGIRRVDALNPTVAARLAKRFESASRFGTQRASRARAVLQELLEANPSNDCREIVARILG